MVALQQGSRQRRDDFRIARRKLLLVEGEDEQRVFTALALQMGISDVQIHPYRGRERLRPFLMNLTADPNFSDLSSISVVMDADTDSSSARDRIRGALESAGLPSPRSALTSASDGNLTVLFLVVPHGSNQGALEDVVLASVADDPAIECVEQFFQCIAETTLPGPRQSRQSKARVHAFLASREDPTLRLGEAAQRGEIWRLDADSFIPLKRLLNLM